MNLIELAETWIRFGWGPFDSFITVVPGPPRSNDCYVYSDNSEFFVGACQKAITIGEFLVNFTPV